MNMITILYVVHLLSSQASVTQMTHEHALQSSFRTTNVWWQMNVCIIWPWRNFEYPWALINSSYSAVALEVNVLYCKLNDIKFMWFNTMKSNRLFKKLTHFYWKLQIIDEASPFAIFYIMARQVVRFLR